MDTVSALLRFPKLARAAGLRNLVRRFQSRGRLAYRFRKAARGQSAAGVDEPLGDQTGEQYMMKRADGFRGATADRRLFLTQEQSGQSPAGKVEMLYEVTANLGVVLQLRE